MSTEPQVFTSEEGPQPTGGESPLGAARSAEDSALDEHPELLVGAAFVGGFALAQILKRLGE